MVRTIVLIIGAMLHQAVGQPNFPTPAGSFIQFLPPAISATGGAVVFGSTVSTTGKVQDHLEIYVGTKSYLANIAATTPARATQAIVLGQLRTTSARTSPGPPPREIAA